MKENQNKISDFQHRNRKKTKTRKHIKCHDVIQKHIIVQQ